MARKQPAERTRAGFTSGLFDVLSPGSWAIVLLAVVSSAVIPFLGRSEQPGLEMWMFSPEHNAAYSASTVKRWNEDPDLPDVNMRVFGIPALERRMMGGFLSGVETADLIEIERQMIGPALAGPIDAVGFVDLTDWLEDKGLRERINEPSFSPWMSRGRIFGMPHDVHPVMLGYRADIVEAAGIDVSEIETWDDFRRVMAPLMTDENGDGQPDRYLLALWPTQWEKIEILILQGGGRIFDENGIPTLDDPRNAEILAEVVSWCVGADRFTADVGDFTNASNNQKIEGYAIAYFMPDWMCRIWKDQIPQLSGKVKVMRLPAFADDPERRRTSVWGGSMLGIPKSSDRQDEALRFAEELYFTESLALRLYTESDIVTPIVEHWDSPVFDEPDAYFSGQAKGRMYVELAPEVPFRPSSPFSRDAGYAARDAAYNVLRRARERGLSTPAELLPIAQEELAAAQAALTFQIGRNVFLTGGED